jgi:hypothetical protein
MPQQLPVVEQGGAGGLPLANATFISQWHDTYRAHLENIIVTQSGASVRTDDVTNLPDTLLRWSGLYFLDLWASHSNTAFLPMIIHVDFNMASALGATVGTASLAFVAPINEVVGGNVFSTTVRIPSRLFRVRWTYPASNSTYFGFSAVLRSA